MKKYCFTMKINYNHLNDYIHLHKNAWPELLQCAKASGAESLIIYISENLSIVLFECEDLDDFYQKYNRHDVVKKWNELTAPWIEESPKIDGSGSVKTVDKIFDLNQQLNGKLNPD